MSEQIQKKKKGETILIYHLVINVAFRSVWSFRWTENKILTSSCSLIFLLTIFLYLFFYTSLLLGSLLTSHFHKAQLRSLFSSPSVTQHAMLLATHSKEMLSYSIRHPSTAQVFWIHTKVVTFGKLQKFSLYANGSMFE
jgi:hypothetical protein